MKKIYGVGINDANYKVQIFETIGVKDDGSLIRKILWHCPYYTCWKNMLRRCYSEKFLKKNPSYLGCYTVPEWHYFMAFRVWMEKQDWKGKSLDKDLIFPGNKVYGPETCIFISAKINTFITESNSSRGEWPIGVYFNKKKQEFVAQCNDIETGKNRYLGRSNDAQEAHKKWLTFKLEQAMILASREIDERIAKALIERYLNYQTKGEPKCE